MAGEKSTGYKNKWQQEHRVRINLTLPIGAKEKIRAAADMEGESVTRYIQRAIETRMGEKL